MRGSPLLRAFLAFLIIAALGWPLWQLTRPAAAAKELSLAPALSPAKAISLQLTFTVPPKSFAIRHLDTDLWLEIAPAAMMERELSLPFPVQGVDLRVHLEWPDDAPLAAARVRLTDPAGDIHEKSLWGQGTLDEVLTFP